MLTKNVFIISAIILTIILLSIIFIPMLFCVFKKTFEPQIPIYIISLEKSTNRKNYINDMFKNKGINFEYFDAVDGRRLNKDQEKLAEKYISKDATFNKLSGTTGCYLSHVLLLQHIKKLNHPHTLVMEDDINISNFDVIRNLKKVIVDNYDIIFLGHCYENEKGKPIKEFFKMYESNTPLCTHGYLISYNGVCKLLDIFEKTQGKKPVDHVFKDSKLNNYSVFPQVIEQSKNNGFKSTVDFDVNG
jgi:glycosyl transferase family 25